MENSNFDKLVNDVMNNPELLLDKNIIDDDILLKIQKKINPYSRLINSDLNENNKQIAVCSYTNLREDYIRRFTMTSMISFLFQVCHEYDVPKNERIWIPKEEQSNELFNLIDLKGQLEGVMDVINQAIEIEEEVKEIQKELIKTELIEDKKDTSMEERFYKEEEKRVGLLYTITQIIKDLGIKANSKLFITSKEAMKFPDIRNIINAKLHTMKEFPENEIPNENAKNIIISFLKNWFSFDPSIHVKNGLNDSEIKKEIKKFYNNEIIVDPIDTNHLTIEQLKSKIKPMKSDQEYVNIIYNDKKSYNAAVHILRDENMHIPIMHMLNNVETFKNYLMPLHYLQHNYTPPQDTFHRLNYYTEVNYEELRTITETLYPERPDLDWAIAIWNTFTGTDEEVETQFNNYCQKYHDELPSVIKSIEIGKWCFLGDFKENRKNIQFYNKNTEVLKRIIDRHTEDKKIGTELMKNRVRHAKAKNIMESGPDAPGLSTYKSMLAGDKKDMLSKNVECVISKEEMMRLEKSHGNIKAAKELEVVEECEKTINNLEDIKKYRELTNEENIRYNDSQMYLKKAKEMLDVPDDAIQVDVFVNDTKNDNFTKSHFYTKCEEKIIDENETI